MDAISVSFAYFSWHMLLSNQVQYTLKTLSFLSEGKSPVVLFFYPKAATPGCTKEVRIQSMQTDDASVLIFNAAIEPHRCVVAALHVAA